MTKRKLENLSNLASQVVSASARGYALVQHQVSEVGASALEAGRSMRHAVTETIVQIDASKVTAQAKEWVHSASAGTQKLTSQVVDLARRADANHKEVADTMETVSMGLGITAGVSAAGAAIAAPNGIGAVGVALGLTSAPLIVTAAPVLPRPPRRQVSSLGVPIFTPNGAQKPPRMLTRTRLRKPKPVYRGEPTNARRTPKSPAPGNSCAFLAKIKRRRNNRAISKN